MVVAYAAAACRASLGGGARGGRAESPHGLACCHIMMGPPMCSSSAHGRFKSTHHAGKLPKCHHVFASAHALAKRKWPYKIVHCPSYHENAVHHAVDHVMYNSLDVQQPTNCRAAWKTRHTGYTKRTLIKLDAANSSHSSCPAKAIHIWVAGQGVCQALSACI
jgi:hypothetical protein